MGWLIYGCNASSELAAGGVAGMAMAVTQIADFVQSRVVTYMYHVRMLSSTGILLEQQS